MAVSFKAAAGLCSIKIVQAALDNAQHLTGNKQQTANLLHYDGDTCPS